MQTLRPPDATRRAIRSTSGVFPVPPAVILPTLINGTGRRETLSIPRRYNADRVPTTAPYNGLNGLNSIDSGFIRGELWRPPLFRRRSRHVRSAFRSATAWWRWWRLGFPPPAAPRGARATVAVPNP